MRPERRCPRPGVNTREWCQNLRVREWLMTRRHEWSAAAPDSQFLHSRCDFYSYETSGVRESKVNPLLSKTWVSWKGRIETSVHEHLLRPGLFFGSSQSSSREQQLQAGATWTVSLDRARKGPSLVPPSPGVITVHCPVPSPSLKSSSTTGCCWGFSDVTKSVPHPDPSLWGRKGTHSSSVSPQLWPGGFQNTLSLLRDP